MCSSTTSSSALGLFFQAQLKERSSNALPLDIDIVQDNPAMHHTAHEPQKPTRISPKSCIKKRRKRLAKRVGTLADNDEDQKCDDGLFAHRWSPESPPQPSRKTKDIKQTGSRSCPKPPCRLNSADCLQERRVIDNDGGSYRCGAPRLPRRRQSVDSIEPPLFLQDLQLDDDSITCVGAYAA